MISVERVIEELNRFRVEHQQLIANANAMSGAIQFAEQLLKEVQQAREAAASNDSTSA